MNECYGDKGCNESIQMDAIAYIQHLESERDAALAKVPKEDAHE